MRVLLGLGHDLDEVDLLGQPVGEVRKRRIVNLLGEQVAYVLVACIEVLDALAVALRVEVLAVVERSQARLTVFHRDVERRSAEALGEDHLVHSSYGHAQVQQAAAQIDEKQRQRREALLPSMIAFSRPASTTLPMKYTP